MQKVEKRECVMVEILGIGSPIVDYILPINEEFLNSIPGKKGGMQPISHHDLHNILKASQQIPIVVAGGSCSNTIKALSRFGHQCAISGKIGNDPLALFYLSSIAELQIKSYFKTSNLPTAQVICLIDPEGKRTCRSYLGATVEMSGQDLQKSEFEGMKHVHLEGYGLFNLNLTETAMKFAKEAGAKISFDLGSFEVVERFRSELLRLIPDYVDILFCNEDECRAFTKKAQDHAFLEMAELCETVIIMLGKDGCWCKKNHQEHYQKAFKVDVKDTTGAGDFFASGFLHGDLTHLPLSASAWIGTLAASYVIQHYGADIPEEDWMKILARIEKEMNDPFETKSSG